MVSTLIEKEARLKRPSEKVRKVQKSARGSRKTRLHPTNPQMDGPSDLAAMLNQAAVQLIHSMLAIKQASNIEEERFKKDLVELDLIKEIKPPTIAEDDWIPVRAKGRPLSELIIEERR